MLKYLSLTKLSDNPKTECQNGLVDFLYQKKIQNHQQNGIDNLALFYHISNNFCHCIIFQVYIYLQKCLWPKIQSIFIQKMHGSILYQNASIKGGKMQTLNFFIAYIIYCLHLSTKICHLHYLSKQAFFTLSCWLFYQD